MEEELNKSESSGLGGQQEERKKMMGWELGLVWLKRFWLYVLVVLGFPEGERVKIKTLLNERESQRDVCFV